ncbi:MAG TPA: RDD family protein [Tepidisphaeraceae bacterium]|jgi:uncharacterized RDD family membrane protein YckC|nr:RDD family protein [Tepidisphaeraceae bacterium]
MPESEWYYAQNDRQFGPVTLQALTDMIRQGHVLLSDLVWTENMPDWRPASETPELAPCMAAPSAAPTAANLNPWPAGTSLNYFSPVATAAVAAPYAGFWMRFVAFIIDAIILGVAAALLEAFIGGAGVLTVFPRNSFAPVLGIFGLAETGKIALGWLYNALMESSRCQGSVGKLALGLAVTDMAGQRIGFGQATGRHFGKYLSYMTMFIGFMMAGWTEKKQALHDMLAGCLVVRIR